MFKDIKSYTRLLVQYTRHFKGKILLGFSISLVFTVFSLATPFLTRFLLDRVLLGKAPVLLTKLLLLMVGILVVFSLTDIISNYMVFVVFQKVGRNIRFDFFKKLQHFSTDFFSDRKIGEITFRLFNDTQVIEESFSSMPLNLFLDCFFLLGVGTVMFIWNWALTLFVMAVLLFQILVIIRFTKPLLKYSHLNKTKSEELSSYAIEHFSGIELVKVSGCERREQNVFLGKLNELMKLTIKYFVLNKFSDTSVGLINQVWSFGILWYGGVQVIEGRLTIGTLMGFLLLTGMLFSPISRITQVFLGFQNVRASISRFLEFYDKKTTIQERKDPIQLLNISGHIKVENLSFGYTLQRRILEDISMELLPRQIVALVGKSGSGKTTLCRLLMRFYDPLAGRILVDGHDLRDVDLRSYRRHIGLFLQNHFVFSGTIKDNIAYCLEGVEQDEIEEAAKKANAHEFIKQLPDGYHTEVGEKGIKLSGGEAQRIALARIFLKSPRIVILDEPTSFVDVGTEGKIKQAILRLKEVATVLIIAHRLSTVQMADKIFLIQDKQLNEYHNFNHLAKDIDFYQEINYIEK